MLWNQEQGLSSNLELKLLKAPAENGKFERESEGKSK